MSDSKVRKSVVCIETNGCAEWNTLRVCHCMVSEPTNFITSVSIMGNIKSFDPSIIFPSQRKVQIFHITH